MIHLPESLFALSKSLYHRNVVLSRFLVYWELATNWPQIGTERCESGRIGVTANDLTGETRSVGSNPTLSAHGKGFLLIPASKSTLINTDQ